jgi:class 3 adenylate cyclase
MSTATMSESAWFLLTDLEDSTRLWERDRANMEIAMRVHDVVVARAIEAYDGRVFKHTGDGLLAVFAVASRAVSAGLLLQRRLARTTWPTYRRLRARVGIAGGPRQARTSGWIERGGDYFGPGVNRCARLSRTADAAQVVCSTEVVIASIAEQREAGLRFQDLGLHDLAGIDRPERVFRAHQPAVRGTDRLPFGSGDAEVSILGARAHDVPAHAFARASRPDSCCPMEAGAGSFGGRVSS